MLNIFGFGQKIEKGAGKSTLGGRAPCRGRGSLTISCRGGAGGDVRCSGWGPGMKGRVEGEEEEEEGGLHIRNLTTPTQMGGEQNENENET